MARTAEQQARIDADMQEFHSGRFGPPRYIPPRMATDQNLPLLGCALAGLMLVVFVLLFGS